MDLLDRLALIGDAFQSFWLIVLAWTVLVTIAYTVFAILPRRFAAAQHDLRLAALFALPAALLAARWTTLPAPAWIPSMVVPELVIGHSGPTAPAVEVVAAPLPILLGALSLLAAVVAVVALLRLLADYVALRKVLSAAKPVVHSETLSVFARVLSDLGLPSHIPLLETTMTAVPFVAGPVRPVVVLPALRPQEQRSLRMIFAHECAHIARQDHRTGPFSRLVAALFAVHPVVTRLSASLTYFREAACDDFVVSSQSIGKSAYARLLFELAQGRGNEPVPALSIHSHPSQLKQRIQAMSHSEPVWARRAGRVLAFLLLITLTFTAACTDPASTADELAADAPQSRAAEAGGDVFTVVEKMPEMIGGVEALASAINYPAVAKEAGIEGRVFVEFVVDEQGEVQSAEVVRGTHEALDAEALRAVQTLKFVPGQQRGQAVKVKLTLPVTYRLQ